LFLDCPPHPLATGPKSLWRTFLIPLGPAFLWRQSLLVTPFCSSCFCGTVGRMEWSGSRSCLTYPASCRFISSLEPFYHSDIFVFVLKGPMLSPMRPSDPSRWFPVCRSRTFIFRPFPLLTMLDLPLVVFLSVGFVYSVFEALSRRLDEVSRESEPGNGVLQFSLLSSCRCFPPRGPLHVVAAFPLSELSTLTFNPCPSFFRSCHRRA